MASLNPQNSMAALCSQFELNARLLRASIDGDLEKIRKALKNGANNHGDACMVAFYDGRIDIFKYVLRAYKSDDVLSFSYVYQYGDEDFIGALFEKFENVTSMHEDVFVIMCATRKTLPSCILHCVQGLPSCDNIMKKAFFMACKHSNLGLIEYLYPYCGLSWNDACREAILDKSMTFHVFCYMVKRHQISVNYILQRVWIKKLDIEKYAYTVAVLRETNISFFRDYLFYKVVACMNYRIFPSGFFETWRFIKSKGLSDPHEVFAMYAKCLNKRISSQSKLFIILSRFQCRDIVRFLCCFVGLVNKRG